MRLLDLFCGAGGAGMGYHRAGFEVVGVDNRPQPHYPFTFVQADALEYCAAHGREFDAIHASPPCQPWTQLPNVLHAYPRLIAETREALVKSGKPFVIENVKGARREMINPIFLCGLTFGLKVYRHRYFEINPWILTPPHMPHPDRIPPSGHGASPNGYISITGNGGAMHLPTGWNYLNYARFAMGIDWMARDEISQAIPPAYTEWIGKQLIAALERSHA